MRSALLVYAIVMFLVGDRVPVERSFRAEEGYFQPKCFDKFGPTREVGNDAKADEHVP